MKKNGFTLVELIAVLVILSIIGLLATPNITLLTVQPRFKSITLYMLLMPLRQVRPITLQVFTSSSIAPRKFFRAVLQILKRFLNRD